MKNQFLKEHIEKLKIETKGVIHVGAHLGKEMIWYDELNFKNIIFFEPLNDIFKRLSQNCEKYKKEGRELLLVNKALGNFIGESSMYVEKINGGQSSSILKPKEHLKDYPRIVFNDKQKINVSTLNEELKGFEKKYNVLNMDVQGYELEVLRGASNILPNIQIINSEINRKYMYENGALVEEIDEFLSEYNFTRIHTKWFSSGWGDGIYLKNGI